MDSSTFKELTEGNTMTLAQSLQSQVNIQPTNLQQTVVIAALSLLDCNSKQMWHFYSGMGKSCIVATLALMACLANLYKQITIVILNGYLLQRDRDRFAVLLQSFSQQITYTSELDFVVTPNQLVIVDEADDLLYKQPSAFFNLGANKMRRNTNTNPKIICMTATKGFQTKLWK